MPARRRHYPGRGPAAGISGTRAAYDQCATCGHARVTHTISPPAGCSGLAYVTRPDGKQYSPPRMGVCPCPGFKERQE